MSGSSNIVAFPLCRRRELVNDLATVLAHKHGAKADTFWKVTAKQLIRSLLARGVSLEDAQSEVRNLLSEVIRQVMRFEVARKQTQEA